VLLKDRRLEVEKRLEPRPPRSATFFLLCRHELSAIFRHRPLTQQTSALGVPSCCSGRTRPCFLVVFATSGAPLSADPLRGVAAFGVPTLRVCCPNSRDVNMLLFASSNQACFCCLSLPSANERFSYIVRVSSFTSSSSWLFPTGLLLLPR